MADRWATFDCYGTLIDWNGGVRGRLGRLFGAGRAPACSRATTRSSPSRGTSRRPRYREVWPSRCARPRRRAAGRGRTRSPEPLPGWPPFREAPAGARRAAPRGWRLAMLSNTDRDLIDASEASSASRRRRRRRRGHRLLQARACHWERFFERPGRPRPARPRRREPLPRHRARRRSASRRVWINRLGEAARPGADARASRPARPAGRPRELVAP